MSWHATANSSNRHMHISRRTSFSVRFCASSALIADCSALSACMRRHAWNSHIHAHEPLLIRMGPQALDHPGNMLNCRLRAAEEV